MEESKEGKHCIILHPLRDHAGHVRYAEQPLILKVIHNLDRLMLLVQFLDGSTTFLFPEEVQIV